MPNNKQTTEFGKGMILILFLDDFDRHPDWLHAEFISSKDFLAGKMFTIGTRSRGGGHQMDLYSDKMKRLRPFRYRAQSKILLAPKEMEDVVKNIDGVFLEKRFSDRVIFNLIINSADLLNFIDNDCPDPR